MRISLNHLILNKLSNILFFIIYPGGDFLSIFYRPGGGLAGAFRGPRRAITCYNSRGEKPEAWEDEMKVKDLMTEKVLTVSPEDRVDRVFFLFNFENIRHVPVVEKGRLVGIVSDRDIKKILGPVKKTIERADGTSVTISSRKVRTLLSRKPVTIEPEQRAADAAAIMAKRKIGALPVVHKDKLVGIITATDILRAFVKLCNAVEPFTSEKDAGS